MAMGTIRRLARSDGGAAAIEFAIIVWALIFLCLGVIEIGRGLHVRNEMSYAADLAARMMLSFPQYSGEVLHPDCEERLRKKVREAFTGPRPDDLSVDFSIDEANTFRSILIRYPFTLLIPGLGDTFDLTVTRRVPTGDSGPCPAAS
jgi:Flp pilus assembly pilin Flp